MELAEREAAVQAKGILNRDKLQALQQQGMQMESLVTTQILLSCVLDAVTAGDPELGLKIQEDFQTKLAALVVDAEAQLNQAKLVHGVQEMGSRLYVPGS